MPRPPLELAREPILAFRRRVGALDDPKCRRRPENLADRLRGLPDDGPSRTHAEAGRAVAGLLLWLLAATAGSHAAGTLAEAPVAYSAADHVVYLPAVARGTRKLHVVDQIGGAMEAVAVQGPFAYVGVGPRLQIIDVSDPAAPRLVGQTVPMEGTISAVVASGSHAYTLHGSGTGRVIDVHEPTAPVPVGAFPAPYASSIAVNEPHLYFAVGGDFVVLDVSEPEHPREVGRLARMDTEGEGSQLAVVGDFVYMTTKGGGKIISVADPAAPALAGPLGVEGEVVFAVHGRDVFFAGRDESGEHAVVSIYDASEPTRPRLRGRTLAGKCCAWNGGTDGRLAFVAGDDLVVIDVTDPEHPRATAQLELVGEVGGVAAASGRAYVAGGDGLRVIDVRDPEHPIDSAAYRPLGVADALAVDEAHGLLFVLDQARLAVRDRMASYLWTFELPTAGSPRVLSRVEVPNAALWLAYRDGQLVVVGNRQGAGRDPGRSGYVLVMTPGPRPVEAGRLDAAWQAEGMALGDDAFVESCCTPRGLRAIDLDDPRRPVEVGVVEVASRSGAPSLTDAADGSTGSFALAGHHVIGVDLGSMGAASRMWAVDVSDPAHMRMAGGARVGTWLGYISVQGDVAYLTGSNRMVVVGIADPSHPVERGGIAAPQGEYFTAILPGRRNGEALWLGSERVLVVDATDPDRPRIAGESTVGGGTDAVVVGDRILIAAGGAGLWVVEER